MTWWRWLGVTVILLGSLLLARLTLERDRETHLQSVTTSASGARTVSHPIPLSIGQFLVFPQLPATRKTYLIAGVTPQYAGYHQRAPEAFNGLTDTMLLVQLDPASTAVHVLSLPRDTQVTLDGQGVHKLNAALPLLGPDGLVRTVSALTGLEVSGYLLINLNAVRDLTDALGGVTVFVPEDMNYDDTAAGLHIHLKRGEQLLNGAQAEGFIRFRHDALGDIGRIQRQQTYLRAAAKVLLSPALLSHLPALSDVLNRDTRMDLGSVDISGVVAMMLRRPAVETSLLPGRFLDQDGISYWQVDPAGDSDVLVNFGLFRPSAQAVPVNHTEVSIALMRAGASEQTLVQLRRRLLAAGYRQVMIGTGDVPQVRATTVLSNTSLSQATTVQRAASLPGTAVVSGEGVLWANVTIWAGKDADFAGGVVPASVERSPVPPTRGLRSPAP